MGGGDKISCRLHFLYRFHPTTTAGEPHAHILSQPLHLLARDMHLDTAQGIASDVVRIIVKRNAVLGHFEILGRGNVFGKKSLRHQTFVPRDTELFVKLVADQPDQSLLSCRIEQVGQSQLITARNGIIMAIDAVHTVRTARIVRTRNRIDQQRIHHTGLGLDRHLHFGFPLGYRYTRP